VPEIKEPYHPNAYLQNVNNLGSGLLARTKILNQLNNKLVTAGVLARLTGMSYSALIHHLRLLEKEEIIDRRGKRPYMWFLTGLGQKRLFS
jgi:DNA-binding transcriptional ArsR family regulator